MKAQLLEMLASQEGLDLGLYVVSAFRSVEQQRVLFEAAVRKYGSYQAARKWVAPPGTSRHGPVVEGKYGIAVDLGLPGVKAVQGQWPDGLKNRVNALAARYGLQSPMAWEDWHYQPRTDLLFKYHQRITPTEEDEVKSVFIIDSKGPDDLGRDSHWEIELETGNVLNWNGARPIRSLREVDPNAVLPLISVVPDPSGDGFVCLSDDERQDERSHWVRSTYKLVVS